MSEKRPARRRKRAAGAALALLLGGASALSAQTTFVDVTGPAGVGYLQHAAQPEEECVFFDNCEPERMTGGAATADIDGDGDLDLFVTRLDAPDILFHNRGDGTFEDATAAVGLSGFDLQSNGCAFGDVDNDGDADLLVTVIGSGGDLVNNRNYLFINGGSGTFTEEAVLRGADATWQIDRMNWSATFGDYDRDGFLDVFVTDWSGGSRLLRNRGAEAPGFFEDATDGGGLSLSGVRAFAGAFVDLDGDGWQDLAIAADFGTSRLYWNNQDGTFSDGTVSAGVGTDENGMGSTFGDVEGDGDLDWFVTSIFDANETCEQAPCNWGYSGNRLYANQGGRVFADATDSAGVRDGAWGWGAAFFDYDNDGDLDLAMTNGVDFPESSMDDPFNADAMRVWENDGAGVMAEVAAVAQVTDTGSGKGLLVFDYDDDGDVDLFVVNNAGAPRLYRNELPSGNDWIRVRAIGNGGSNLDAFGARVLVWETLAQTPQMREVGASSHFVGHSENTVHFGLGSGVASVEQIEVHFPASGVTVTLGDVPTGQTHLVPESVATVPFLTASAMATQAAMLVALGAWTLASNRRGSR